MTSSRTIPEAMILGFEEEKLVNFWTFQVWMGHYTDNIRAGRESQYQIFLEKVVAGHIDPTDRATAKAVYKWGPRLDITKMPS